jgi:transcription termination/antitermination protein NusA
LTRRIYDETILKYIPLFESLTGAKIKDCIVDEDKIIFIIEKGNMGLAIGKHGSNLRRVEGVLKKPLRIIEFDENASQFIKNYTYPINSFEVEQNEKIITLKGRDTKTKAMLIGRDRANLKKMLGIVKRFFDIEDINVI